MNTQEAIGLLEELKEVHNYTPPYTEALTHAIEHMKRWQWRPIESAPRDGTRVLLLMSCNKQCVARTEYHPFNGPQWVIYGEIGRPDCWALAVDDNDTNPTHWKPLDEPPQERKTK